MDQQLARKLQQVGEGFHLRGPFFSYEEVSQGNVNRTYKANYIRDDGTGMAVIKSYLVQRVNTYAFRNPVQLMENIDQVTEYIREKMPEKVSLHYHHTDECEGRKTYLMDEDGSFWRICNYVPSVTFDTCDDLRVVRNAGEAFGEFQMALSDFDASRLYYTIPDFHNTRKRYETLIHDAEADPCGRVAEVKEELDWLLSVQDQACKLTDMFNAGELPLRVTHNDTKINNVLFDVDTHEALVVVDLDTVIPGLVGHDFGTAKTLTENEIATLGLSCFVLACELATRFLDDYINGDKYFNVKKEKHNLVRTRCQIALAKDMLEKMDAMQAIVNECARKYRQ